MEENTEAIVTETIDNGVIENVHISPIGEFIGSDAEGKPMPETIDKDSLEALAEKLNADGNEVLCDVDHGASREGVDKDTKAAGWFTKFIVDPLKGLFARLKLTRHGKELLENREYRYISPTFTLDENGKPVELHTASLTNRPAFAGHIDPILNQEATEDLEKGIENMTKEELVDLIKETVKNMETAEDKAEEVEKTEVAETEEKLVETKDETSNSCSGDEAKAENACAEEPKAENEEPKKEEEVKEEKKEEVIKIETLNSAPRALASVGDDSWKNLHGDAFWKWLREHPEAK